MPVLIESDPLSTIGFEISIAHPSFPNTPFSTIVGTFFGLILIQILKNGLSLAGVKSDGTYIAIGLVLILTLLISNLFNRNSEG